MVDPRSRVNLTHLPPRVTMPTKSARPEVAAYDCFYDPAPDEPGQDVEKAWDPSDFDAHYDDGGYYETGLEYVVREGGAEEVFKFHYDRGKKRVLDWMEPAAGHTILEIGCGAGWFIEEIFNKYSAAGYRPNVVALEASKSQLRFAAQRIAKNGLDPIVPVLGNAEALPFADGSFDVVSCCDVLVQVRNPARAIQEVRRVLKPGGSAYFLAPSRLNEILWDFVLAPGVRFGKALLGKSTGFKQSSEFYAPLYPEVLGHQVNLAGLLIEQFELTGAIPHNHYFEILPRIAVRPAVAAFDWLDTKFGHRLPSLASHILICATKPVRNPQP